MRLYEIIRFREIEIQKGYAITEKKVALKNKKIFVNDFFGDYSVKENEEVGYVSSIERIAQKGDFFIVDHGECFMEQGKIFTKNNKTIEKLMHKAKDMTKIY